MRPHLAVSLLAALAGGVVVGPVAVGAAPPAPNPNIELTQIYAEEFREILEERFGPIPGDVIVDDVDATIGDDTDAIARFDNGAYYECALPWSSSVKPDLGTIARMVGQCFVAAVGGEDAYISVRSRPWLFDGSTGWMALNITNPAGSAGWWANYLQSPETPLFSRGIDAIGFFAHLSETGIDTFAAMKQMWAADGDAAAFSVSGATSDAFMTTWAAGLARMPDRGSAWDATGPYMPGDSAPISIVSVANGTSTDLTAAPYSNGLYQLDLTADIVTLTGSGYVRLSDTALDIAQVTSNTYCARSGGCDTCPDGSPISNPPPPIQPGPLVAVSSGATASTVTINGQQLPCEDEEDEDQAVIATVDRPGMEGVLPGTVVELRSCTGPYGDWSGVFRLGGLSLNGFEVPFVEIPVSFTFEGSDGTQTATTSTSGNVPTPAGDFAVTYDLTITVDGSTMSITGTGDIAGQTVALSDQLPGQLSGIPIEPTEAC